ncbi:hypothetical protein [Pseudoduganella lutea]|uniref:Uncharacterized protein n=1 Tax=Pseudoduganella lutea TaxID=321985 RepID=A0A4P6KUT1_9BURK|nr:hypothetical protein [Pseudoduganella lutea]QBE62182.1 hypothetical protein EWM63_03605 [Pseudoduganella lutea]
MSRSDDIHRMEITCTERDAYTIDIGFSFISMNEKAYLVDGICVENDIFEVKAHTLANMLARSITLPRTIRFGFSENDARHVAFAFSAGPGESILLACKAFEPSWRGAASEGISFEAGDENALSRLLEGFDCLKRAGQGTFVWPVGQ